MIELRWVYGWERDPYTGERFRKTQPRLEYRYLALVAGWSDWKVVPEIYEERPLD